MFITCDREIINLDKVYYYEPCCGKIRFWLVMPIPKDVSQIQDYDHYIEFPYAGNFKDVNAVLKAIENSIVEDKKLLKLDDFAIEDKWNERG